MHKQSRKKKTLQGILSISISLALLLSAVSVESANIVNWKPDITNKFNEPLPELLNLPDLPADPRKYDNLGEINRVKEGAAQSPAFGNDPDELPLFGEAPEEAPAFVFADFTYTLINGSFIRITGYTGSDTAVVIPGTVDSYIVQEIATNAFRNNTAITSISFPDSLEIISANAFQNCSNLSGIGFNNGLKTIGNYAFAGCISLTGMTLPNTLTAINTYAFDGCSGLLSLNFPNTVATIGDYAFRNCTQLSSITYPMGWASVLNGYIFQGCTSLLSITVPEGVTAMPAAAFRGCTYIQAISLPSTLKSIGNNTFNGCSGLTGTINIPFGVTTIGDNAFQGCTGLANVNLPESLTTINQYAFNNCSSFTNIILPDSLTSIGGSAFRGCTNLGSINYPAGWKTVTGSLPGYIYTDCPGLLSITVPEGVTALPVYAFRYCANLQTVNLPESLESVANYAFGGCSGISGTFSLPQAVTAIGEYAFQNCTGLANINLPTGLLSIGQYAFNGCSNFTAISLPDSLTSIGGNSFSNCSSLSSINYPLGWTTVTGNPAGNIFTGCNLLTAFTVSEGITALLNNAFNGCSNFKTINLPSTLLSVGANAFNGCTNLAGTFSLPSGVTSIGGSAFLGCTGLAEINLPGALLTIGVNAFDGCTNLTSLTLPDSVTSLGSAAFRNCTKLSSINYPLSLTTISGTGNLFQGCTSLFTIVVPEGVTALPANAFYGCTYLRTVKLPVSLLTVGNSAFYNCTSLEAVWIDAGVTAMNNNVFINCAKLTIHGIAGSYANTFAVANSIPFSSELLLIDLYSTMAGNVAVSGGSGLSGVSVMLYDLTLNEKTGTYYTNASGNWLCATIIIGHTYQVRYYHPLYSFSANNGLFEGITGGVTTPAITAALVYAGPSTGFTYTVIDALNIRITGYTGSATAVVIPDSIDGYNVKEITASAFRNMTAITSIALPQNLEIIGNTAFQGCTGLIQVGVNNGLLTIGTSTFEGCSSLSAINLPNTVSSIGNYAFRNCSSLGSINYPVGWTTLTGSPAGNIFTGCPLLTSITVPEGVTVIPANALRGCPDLLTVNLPASLISIGDYAFTANTGLTGINLGAGLENIGINAFEGCTGFTAITLPDSVASIGSYAFRNCTNLNSINYPAGWTTVSGTAGCIFAGCPLLTTITVPLGVTALPAYAFRACPNLQTINIPSSLVSVGNYAFSGCTGLAGVISLPFGVTSIGDYAFQTCTGLANINLPDTLATIGPFAFEGCTNFTGIYLPDSLTTMGRSVFRNCTKLSSINYPRGLTTMSGNPTGYIFDGCTSLLTLVVPEGVTALPAYVFQGCTYLRTVKLPVSLDTVGNYAFYGCTGLEAVWIDTQVTAMSTNVFTNCRNLTIHGIAGSYANTYALANSIPFSTDLLEIDLQSAMSGRVVLSGGSGLAGVSVMLYDLTNNLPEGIYYTDAGGNWFSNTVVLGHTYQVRYYHPFYSFFANNELFQAVTGGVTTPPITATLSYSASSSGFTYSQIDALNIRITGYSGSGVAVIPDAINGFNVQEIGASAFRDKTTLTAVVLPNNLLNISDYAFQGCTNLAIVKINNGVKTVGAYAFSGCSSITAIDLPNCVTAIGGGAFRNCGNLSSINYPAGWTSVSSGPAGIIFEGCPLLTSIIVPEGVTALPANAFSGCPYLHTITLPSTLLTIGNSSFYGCTGFSGTYSIPSQVTVIGDYAFRGCTGLTNLNMPPELKSIGYYAFEGCTNLTNVSLPDSITSIGGHAFRGCANLSSINYPASWAEVTIAIPGGGSFGYIFADCPLLTTITVPEGVTALPDYVFLGCPYLQTVNLPDTLESIGERAFSDCSGLPDICLPDTLVSIGRLAFDGCEGFTSLVLPDGVTTIGDYAFRNCLNLSNINYPLSLATVNGSGYLFAGCISLWQISVPEGVTSMPNYALYGCTFLRTVSLPASLQTIGSYSLGGCTGFTSFTLPGSVTTIGYGSFSGCLNLGLFYLPKSVTTIANYAFNNCPKLTICSDLDSYGMIYAINNGIPYIPTGSSIPDSPSQVLNRALTGYETNFGAVSSSGCLQMILRYAIKEAAVSTVSNLKINIKLPANAELFNSSVTLDGILISEFTNSGGNLSIPVTASSGTIRFSLKPAYQNNIVSYAQMAFRQDGLDKTEIIGVTVQDISILTIKANDFVNSPIVQVRGIAPATSNVELFVDNLSAGTALTSKAGLYSALVTLPAPVNGQTYRISAQAVGGSEEAETYVVYEPDAPVLSQFKMLYNGNEYDLMDTSPAKPTITFAFKPFTFTAKFTNPEVLEEVYIVSDRNNIKKYLPAIWDEPSRQFIASGYFDPLDPNYVPGIITVSYAKPDRNISFSDPVNYNSLEYTGHIPGSVLLDLNNPLNITLTDTSFGGMYNVNGELQIPSQNAKLDYNLLSSAIPAGITAANAPSYGYLPTANQAGEQLFFRITDCDFNTISGALIDFTKAKITDFRIDGSFIIPPLNPVFSFDTVIGKANSFIPYQQIRLQIDEIRETVQKSSLPVSEKLAAIELINTAAKINNGRIGAGLLAIALTFAGAPPDFPASLLLPGLTNKIKTDLADILSGFPSLGISENEGISFSFRWAIDPSGYIYEAVPGNRLPGVKVTALWKENTGDSEAIWDALEYNQYNPLYTDNDGRYAWDVPEGLWQVKAELDGYETGYSEWLPVPPPQTEVNFGLISLAAPQVEWANAYPDAIEISFSKYMQTSSLTPENISVTRGGIPVSGHIEFVNGETANGQNLAGIIRFIPDINFGSGETIQLLINKDVLSYAGVAMANNWQQVISVQPEPESIQAEDIEFAYGQSGSLIVTLTPAAAVVGQKVLAVSSDPLIATVAAEALINEEGKAVIPVSASLPGEITVTLSLEGTSLQTEAKALITMGTATQNGVKVIGKFRSYDPGKITRIQLLRSEKIYTEVIQTTDGYGLLEQEFAFKNVEPGIYDLVITKDVHTKFTVLNVVVGNEDLDLTLESRPEVQLMTLRCGDINGDGLINDADLTVLWRAGNYNKRASEAENDRCDLNGDGLINDADLTILWLAYNYNRGAIIID